MKINRVVFSIMLVMAVAISIVLFPMPVGAQELPTNTLTLTEALLNQVIREGTTDPNVDLSLDMQPGQIVVNLTVTGERGNTLTGALTLVPSVVNGELEVTPTQLTLNGLELPIDNNNPAVASTTDSVSGLLGEQTGVGQVQRVTVTDSQLTLTWLGENPTDPAVTIQDTRVSLTFTESGINAMDWVTNPTDPNVSAINVDLQPGQGVINITRTVEPTSVAYAIIPTVANGQVTWQVNAQADVGGGIANTLLTVWSAYFGGIYGEGSMVDAVVTDNTVTFTWDLERLAGAEPTDPVVTYTVNEAEVNAALAAFVTGDVAALAVDMQPGQVVLSAVGTDTNGNSFQATATLVPVLMGGTLDWRVTGVTYNNFALDEAALAAAGITNTLLQGANHARPGATVTDIQITDDAASVTVHYR